MRENRVYSCFNFSVSPFRRPVMLGESLQLQGIKCIFATSNILHCIFSSTTLTAHALQCLREHLWGHAVLVLQDEALLQCHRHGCAVLGTLAAGKPDPVKAAANLSSLPENVHILILPGMHILTQESKQFWKACLAPRSR